MNFFFFFAVFQRNQLNSPKFSVAWTSIQLASKRITCDDATRQKPSGQDDPKTCGQLVTWDHQHIFEVVKLNLG